MGLTTERRVGPHEAHTKYNQQKQSSYATSLWQLYVDFGSLLVVLVAVVSLPHLRDFGHPVF